MERAELKCPFCGYIEIIEMPKDRCLAFHICKNCGKIISSPENQCCVICAYSNKKCPVSR